MHILIIDQCSGSKHYPDSSPVFDAAAIDAHLRDELLDRPGVAAVPARDLYAGRQQEYIATAVDALRAAGHTVTRYFVSAGFGVVAEREQLPPYEVTFAEMADAEIDARAADLGIPGDVRDLLTTTAFDIGFLALGRDYYRAIKGDERVQDFPDDVFGVVFNREDAVADRENLVSIPARTDEARDHGTIVVALKGLYLQNFAEYLSNGREVQSTADIVEYCTTEYTTQTGFNDF
jgi:hypothetical protein